MSDKSINEATAVIYALQTEFDLPDNVATAATRLYGQYTDEVQEATRQRYLKRVAGACLFLSGKVHGEAPLPDEIADRVDTEKRLFLRTVRNVAGDVGLDPESITDPLQYVNLACEELGLDEAVRRQAEVVVEHAQDSNIVSGKNPRGIAAAAVYLAARMQRVEITQDELADVIDVSVVTIRNRYQEQAELEPPRYPTDVKPAYFDDGSDAVDADFESVVWTGRGDSDSYVSPSDEKLNAAVEALGIMDDEEIIARAQTLFRLAQDAPQCDFASADQVAEWGLAAVCVAAEHHGQDPAMTEKRTVADLINMSGQELEGRCYQLRQAWDSQVTTPSTDE